MSTQEVLAIHNKNLALHAALRWYLSIKRGTTKECDAQAIAKAYVELANAVRGEEGEVEE